MNPTQISILPEHRAKIAANLNVLLASGVDLYLRAKNAHWNAKGPQFIALHQLFDQIATYAASAADDLAERIAALGGVAVGTAAAAGSHSLLPPALPAVTGLEFVKTLSAELAAFVNAARNGIEAAIELGDQASADLLIESAREGDKELWFLEAHLL